MGRERIVFSISCSRPSRTRLLMMRWENACSTYFHCITQVKESQIPRRSTSQSGRGNKVCASPVYFRFNTSCFLASSLRQVRYVTKLKVENQGNILPSDGGNIKVMEPNMWIQEEMKNWCPQLSLAQVPHKCDFMEMALFNTLPKITAVSLHHSSLWGWLKY